MATHTYDDALFRQQFPIYADPTKYPVAQIQMYYTMGNSFISPNDWPGLCGDTLDLALNLMTAHLLALSIKANKGQAASGPISSTSIDRVSVTLQPPPVKNEWQNWLAQTPWGQQLWALLQVQFAGGFLVGGSCERSGFRKAGGYF